MAKGPDLRDQLLSRAFRAANGELAIAPCDVDEFLAACTAENRGILGWEVWLVDHRCGPDGAPIPAKGAWSGLIPRRGPRVPAVISGTIDDRRPNETRAKFSQRSAAAVREQLMGFSPNEEVPEAWRSFVKINFTIA